MCTHRITNPGRPLEEIDAFDSDEECSDPIEDEHHAIFDCSAYADAREQYHDLFQSYITIVGVFLNQPHCNRLAKSLSWIRMLRMNRAWSDGSAPGPEQTLNKQSIYLSLSRPTYQAPAHFSAGANRWNSLGLTISSPFHYQVPECLMRVFYSRLEARIDLCDFLLQNTTELF